MGRLHLAWKGAGSTELAQFESIPGSSAAPRWPDLRQRLVLGSVYIHINQSTNLVHSLGTEIILFGH